MEPDYEEVALDIDVEDLPDSDAIPAGKYKFRIDAVVTGTSKKGVGFFKMKFVVVEGEHVLREANENYIPYKGRAILKKILIAVGWKHKKLNDKNMDKLIGMEFNAITRIESSDEYGDQTRITVYLDPNAAVTEGSEPI